MSNRTLVITLGLIGWGLAFIVATSRKNSARREARLSRKQLATWEGEGGNLTPPPSSAGLPAAQANLH
jgi:hypothetical protein